VSSGRRRRRWEGETGCSIIVRRMLNRLERTEFTIDEAIRVIGAARIWSQSGHRLLDWRLRDKSCNRSQAVVHSSAKIHRIQLIREEE
jgi:hypothetical protein